MQIAKLILIGVIAFAQATTLHQMSADEPAAGGGTKIEVAGGASKTAPAPPKEEVKEEKKVEEKKEEVKKEEVKEEKKDDSRGVDFKTRKSEHKDWPNHRTHFEGNYKDFETKRKAREVERLSNMKNWDTNKY